MAFTSSIPYFKAALLARLQADSTLTALKAGVFWGNPHPAAWPEKGVYIRQASDRRLEYACGMAQANEEYDIHIDCNCAGSPKNACQTYEEGAYGLAAAVEASLLSWTASVPLCSGTWGAVSAAIPKGGSDQEGLEATERDGTVYLLVHVVARLV